MVLSDSRQCFCCCLFLFLLLFVQLRFFFSLFLLQILYCFIQLLFSLVLPYLCSFLWLCFFGSVSASLCPSCVYTDDVCVSVATPVYWVDRSFLSAGNNLPTPQTERFFFLLHKWSLYDRVALWKQHQSSSYRQTARTLTYLASLVTYNKMWLSKVFDIFLIQKFVYHSKVLLVKFL